MMGRTLGPWREEAVGDGKNYIISFIIFFFFLF
jgi:hypothetical protein